MSTELVKRENVEMIVKNAPLSYQENQASHDKCLAFGRQILNDIQKAGSMTDELDQRAAEFIERSKKTVKKMNEKRAPVTKLFDEIRTVFTNLENDVDPTKLSTIPGQLQKLRNEYAKKKREEAERKRREEERRQRIESVRNSYRIAVEEDYRQSFNRFLNQKFNQLIALNNSITLENIDQQMDAIKHFPVTLPENWETTVPSGALLPPELDSATTKDIRWKAMNELLPKFKEQFKFDLEDNRDSILATLPSKKKELQAIAHASAEEAAHRKEEIQRRESEEARLREEERRRKEEEEKQQQQVRQQQVDMAGLFSQSAVGSPIYQPKTQVKKKIVIKSALGFLDILNLWWATEGSVLSVEELSKKFKSQITHCEKLANDKSDPRLIQSDHIAYEEDVKAK